MTFSAPIIAVKEIKRGQSVGYGGIFTAAENTRIAIVAAGYADGYPREIEQGAPVLIDGKRFPLVGRVSMDLICVEIKNSRIEPGDCNFMGRVTPGRGDSAIGETIPYTLLTGSLEGLDASFRGGLVLPKQRVLFIWPSGTE